MNRLTRLAAAATLAVVPLAAVVPAAHGAVITKPGAGADAYVALVDVNLLNQAVPVRTGPHARAAQEFPPGAKDPSTAALIPGLTVPTVLPKLGVGTSMAAANGIPNAVASAQVVEARVLANAGQNVVEADLIRAQSNSDCVKDPNATGTQFVNLKVGGTPIGGNPPPNTTIPLQVVTVIVNEQHPAASGRGLVVNAIHILGTSAADQLIRGDIIISHAVSTVACTNGKGSTGGQGGIVFDKTVTPTIVKPGGTITYTATTTNKGAVDCLINRFYEHAPAVLEFVSTSGDLGTALDITPPPSRPGGGLDLILGRGKIIKPAGKVTQTFVMKVKDDAAPGVYYNQLEVLCANIGNFVSGHIAPFEVRNAVPVKAPPPPKALPHTGNNGALAVLGGLSLLVVAAAVRKFARSAA